MMSPGVTRPLLAPLRSRLSALRRGTWMPTERLAMRHLRDVIRLKSAGMPTREIARRVGTAPSTVRLTIRRFEASGLTWPLPDDITDTELEAGCSPAREPVPAPGGAIAGRPSLTGRRCIANSGAST